MAHADIHRGAQSPRSGEHDSGRSGVLDARVGGVKIGAARQRVAGAQRKLLGIEMAAVTVGALDDGGEEGGMPDRHGHAEQYVAAVGAGVAEDGRAVRVVRVEQGRTAPAAVDAVGGIRRAPAKPQVRGQQGIARLERGAHLVVQPDLRHVAVLVRGPQHERTVGVADRDAPRAVRAVAFEALLGERRTGRQAAHRGAVELHTIAGAAAATADQVGGAAGTAALARVRHVGQGQVFKAVLAAERAHVDLDGNGWRGPGRQRRADLGRFRMLDRQGARRALLLRPCARGASAQGNHRKNRRVHGVSPLYAYLSSSAATSSVQYPTYRPSIVLKILSAYSDGIVAVDSAARVRVIDSAKWRGAWVRYRTNERKRKAGHPARIDKLHYSSRAAFAPVALTECYSRLYFRFRPVGRRMNSTTKDFPTSRSA